MQLNFTSELALLMKFTGETAIAIRMYSAYSGGSPADYLGIPRDPKRESVDLMFLADALHHFESLGRAIESEAPGEIVDCCDHVLRIFSGYTVEQPEHGQRQAKPTFERWHPNVDLERAKRALEAIRSKAAASRKAEPVSSVTELYRVPAPYSMTEEIVVYGEPEMGWYEWRVEADGKVLKDTKDQGYGSPEIALRDALIDTSN